MPHGVLFRSGSEGAIRKSVIEDNLLDGVVGLPGNLFYGAGIPAALLIFDKARKHKGKGSVFFIDASREFEQATNQNRLRPEDIDKIIATYRARKEIAKYAHCATYAEMEENEFNLNIPRYVDTFEPEPEIDVALVQKEIEEIEGKLAVTRKKMAGYLKELDFAD